MKDNKQESKKEDQKIEQNENKENNKENDPAKNEENPEEKKEETKEKEENKEEEKNKSINPEIDYEKIYSEEIIKELKESTKEKRKEIITQIYTDLFKKTGEKMKSNQLKAIFNFHCQNLEFIFKKFNNYSIDIITKIANIFSLLLNLKEEEYNIQIKNLEGAHEDIYKPIPEPDFCYIINKKLMEIKHCFMKFKLFPDPKEKNKETNFYLNNKELNIILSYLNESYFPFIRLFYHVINLNRIETKKINSTVSKPLAVNNNDDTAPEKFIIEEQVKRPIEKEKKIDEMIEKELENKFDSNDLKNRQLLLENKKRNDYANEIRKLISEKVEELKKDVDAKISENGIEIEKNIQNIKEQYLPNNKKK